ncbi:MAG TPA: hypothetical protein PK644_04395 [bacterium]|nr:hypothetical protein [bacterium]
MNDEVFRHCQVLESCRQRSGRMLSVVDLVERGTLSLKAAAVCLEVISNGGSFLVGARPGGSGKTTVMVALLNFIPSGLDIVATDSPRKLRPDFYTRPACVLCPEIGSGPYYGYLWGREKLTAFFSLKRHGHLLASNLHADTLEEAREQICVQNGVWPSLFEAIELHLFLQVEKTGKRILRSGWWLSGSGRYQEIIKDGLLTSSLPFEPKRLARPVSFLETLLNNGVKTLPEVRAGVLSYLKG